MTLTLGQRIAQSRRVLGVKEGRDVALKDLAEAAGVDPSTVSLWEADKKTPREDALARLADYLGVTPAYLRYGVGPGPVREKLSQAEIDAAIVESDAARDARGAADRQPPRRAKGA